MELEDVQMYSRYTDLLPDYAQRAFEAWYAYGADDEKCEEFAGKWGGFSHEHFLQALEQGRGDDRLCAMFALGASPYPDGALALLPFLQSAHRDERCISAIVLGMKGDVRAYPFLEKQLLEGLSLEERLDAFTRDDSATLRDLFLCDRFRPRAVELLETCSSPTLIQTMIQALEALWIVEKACPRFSVEERAYDTICYALGQRGAFPPLDTLDFPLVYQKIAMVYLALGALQLRREPTFMRSVLKSEDLVRNFLRKTFHISGEEAQNCIEIFYQEQEVRRAYRAGLDEQTIGKGIGEHFIVTVDDDFFLKDDAEETLEEEHIEQQEPVSVCVYREHSATVWSVACSPDGTQIVSGGADTTAQVWDIHTGKQITLFRAHQACVTVVAWSPDGEWIASGGCDNRVYVWNARTGEIITTYTEHHAWICNGLAWSPDGEWIASASWDGSVHIWDAMTGKTSLCYLGHQGVVTSVAWSPDGTQIVSGGGYPECAIHIWNSTTGQLSFLYTAHMQDREGTRPILTEVFARDEVAWARGPGSLRSVVWSPDGRWIASVGRRNVFRVWDARTGEDLIARAQNRTDGPLAWSANSTYLATGKDNGVDFWDIRQKSILLNYTPVNRRSVTTLAWSPDMRTLVAGGEHPHICAWKIDLDLMEAQMESIVPS